MTKEMRPSHRMDVLNDALLHYTRRSSDNLGVSEFKTLSTQVLISFVYIYLFNAIEDLLPKRLQKAITTQRESKATSEELMSKAPGTYNESRQLKSLYSCQMVNTKSLISNTSAMVVK